MYVDLEEMMEAAKNPVALVTGSSRGIGRGIAMQLAKEGFSVAITYVGNKEAAKQTAQECYELAGDTGASFEIFKADIGSKENREALVDEVFSTFGTIDILVNNAGMAPKVRADILDASEKSFEDLVRTNTQGPYFLTQAVAKRWLEGGIPSRIESGYKVVFVTSISVDTVSINRGDYCISKAALSMGASLWAARLAPHGMQVYEIRPGIVATDMTAKVKDKYDSLIKDGLIPQERWGEPSDTAKAVAVLAKGYFPYSTGTVIFTDGGMHIPRL